MISGDIRTFEKDNGNAVVFAVGVWAEQEREDDPMQIHLTGTANFHTTVTNSGSSERHHRTLLGAGHLGIKVKKLMSGDSRARQITVLKGAVDLSPRVRSGSGRTCSRMCR